MFDRYKLASIGKTTHVMACKTADAATRAAWVSIGGCSDHYTALRVYLALKSGGGR